jgi:hypothetical protein
MADKEKLCPYCGQPYEPQPKSFEEQLEYDYVRSLMRLRAKKGRYKRYGLVRIVRILQHHGVPRQKAIEAVAERMKVSTRTVQRLLRDIGW